jgi:hypothetical protein
LVPSKVLVPTDGSPASLRALDATLVYVNDVRGHAAVLALFDEVIAAG